MVDHLTSRLRSIVHLLLCRRSVLQLTSAIGEFVEPRAPLVHTSGASLLYGGGKEWIFWGVSVIFQKTRA